MIKQTGNKQLRLTAIVSCFPLQKIPKWYVLLSKNFDKKYILVIRLVSNGKVKKYNWIFPTTNKFKCVDSS